MKYIIIPGLNGSNKSHWQSRWENKLDCIRLEQSNWENPQLVDWLEVLSNVIDNCNEEMILVAHSLGCALVLNWAKNFYNTKIIGALLVAPADVDLKEHTPNVVRNFAPMPLIKLPFKTIVVTSENDPYMKIERSMMFAKAWNSKFINVGKQGHINADSNLGEWEFGLDVLKSLNP